LKCPRLCTNDFVIKYSVQLFVHDRVCILLHPLKDEIDNEKNFSSELTVDVYNKIVLNLSTVQVS
jgi:hypothetical protein